jgi:DNA-binding response OmpR family regulator
MNKIAIVSDDPGELGRLTSIMRRHGQCAPFTDPDAFLHATDHDTHDLALIEWNGPRVARANLVKRIRASSRAPNLPVMLIAARGSDEDEVAGLVSGADDYVARSVCEAILMARVNALLARVLVAADQTMETHGDYGFDRSRLSVMAHGREQSLKAKEFHLAQLLFRNIRRPLGRGYIMEHVWGQNAEISSRTLDTHICRVRTKLGLSPASGYSLTAVYGFGYKLDKLKSSTTPPA